MWELEIEQRFGFGKIAITKTVNSEPTTVNPTYDANGNTLTVGRVIPNAPPQNMTLRYDEENRLVEVSDSTSDSVYTYDGLGRRVEAKVSSWNVSLGTWDLVSDTHYVYDGWRVIEELDSNYNTLRSYTRGLDLSGSLENVGGIGGLLALANYTLGSSTPVSTASYFFDGNGNVIDLVADDGTSAAHYQYSPFGEMLVATGLLATVNPYQFSTKERDAVTGLVYYGKRYYNSGAGRWLSRDPIQEQAFFNQHFLKSRSQRKRMQTEALSPPYLFVGNNPINGVDPLGLTVLFGVNQTSEGRSQVIQMVSYLSQSPTFRAAWQQLVNSNTSYTVTASIPMTPGGHFEENANFGEFDPVTRDLWVDPVEGKQFDTTGGPLDDQFEYPALILAHEVQHAIDYDNGTLNKCLNQRRDPNQPPYYAPNEAEVRAQDFAHKVAQELEAYFPLDYVGPNFLGDVIVNSVTPPRR